MMLLRVVICDPLETKRLLKSNPPKSVGYEISAILGNAVLSNHVPAEWARQRELLKPAFTNAALKELMPVMHGGLKTLLASFHAHCKADENFDLHEEVSAFAFLAIGHSALGEEDEFLTRRAKPLRDAFNVATYKEILRIRSEKDDEYRAAKEEIESFTKETFQRYEKSKGFLKEAATAGGCPVAHTLPESQPNNSHHPKKDTLINIIMAKDANGCPVMDEKLRSSSLSTFMFAGHETTSHSMSWCVLELGRNLHCQRKLQAEIDKHLSQIGGFEKLDYKDLFKFEYLTLCINETLRLWPVVAQGTFRVLTEDTVISGIRVPKNALLSFPHYQIHRDKEVWGETADQFNPERKWVSDAFLPFTIAPRDCLGRNLAMMEMRMTLIAIYSNFNVNLVDPNLEYQGFNTFTLFPEHGVWVKLRKRA